jgi:hypothetical protein
MFTQLQQGVLLMYKLNFGVITLLPKKRRFGTDSAIQTHMFAKCEFQNFHKGGD